MTQHITSLEALQQWANSFLNDVQSPSSTATIVTLTGNLGAGKTAFVKCCAQYFGIKEDITSPTFVIQKEYSINSDKRFSKLVHIDAYRLSSSTELEYLKWEETISDPQTIIFLEWPQMVEGIKLPYHISIHIEINSDESRTIIINQ